MYFNQQIQYMFLKHKCITHEFLKFQSKNHKKGISNSILMTNIDDKWKLIIYFSLLAIELSWSIGMLNLQVFQLWPILTDLLHNTSVLLLSPTDGIRLVIGHPRGIFVNRDKIFMFFISFGTSHVEGSPSG